jgi:predicted Zn-dependent peptidase
MSARLNLRLREQHGYVYQIDTAYLPYADTGLFTIDFSTERKNYKRCLTLIHQELEKVRQQPPGKVQLNRAKRQLLGQASMLEEDPPALMQDMARGLLNHGQVQNYETYAANINAVRADDLSGIATELFEPDRISQLTYMPGAE